MVNEWMRLQQNFDILWHLHSQLVHLFERLHNDRRGCFERSRHATLEDKLLVDLCILLQQLGQVAHLRDREHILTSVERL